MDLPELIKHHARGRSLRAMAQQATDAGRSISHVQLGEYAKTQRPVPSETTRRAIAAALGVSFEEVTVAALRSVAPDVPDVALSPHALAFLRLTEGRTEDEIRRTLGVVEATLHAMAASREAAESNAGGTKDPDTS